MRGFKGRLDQQRPEGRRGGRSIGEGATAQARLAGLASWGVVPLGLCLGLCLGPALLEPSWTAT
jgi:hypothetical protein